MVGIGQDVAVAVYGGLDGGMSQLGLDEFDILVLSDEKRSLGVAQIVETDFSKTCPAKRGGKLPLNEIVRVNGITGLIAEYQIFHTYQSGHGVDFQNLFKSR